MIKYSLLALNALIQTLVLIFLSVALLVLAVIAIFAGDFTMFVVFLSLAYILTHTAVVGATKRNHELADSIEEFNRSR